MGTTLGSGSHFTRRKRDTLGPRCRYRPPFPLSGAAHPSAKPADMLDAKGIRPMHVAASALVAAMELARRVRLQVVHAAERTMAFREVTLTSSYFRGNGHFDLSGLRVRGPAPFDEVPT
jgi:hypothetical protein